MKHPLAWRVLLLSGCLAVQPVIAEDALFEDGPLQVGEGELVFLDAREYSTVMHSRNRIVISDQSLEDGVVAIHQCYDNLDPVPRMDILYRYEQSRAFRIEFHRGIESASLDGQTVSLVNVSRDAALCVAVEAAILHSDGKGRWVLRNGPFHRQFFDGYFPFHVTLRIEYPETLVLRFTRPEAQPGVRIEDEPGQVTLESYFAGKLSTEIGFARR